jgi:hypothetical protein
MISSDSPQQINNHAQYRECLEYCCHFKSLLPSFNSISTMRSPSQLLDLIWKYAKPVYCTQKKPKEEQACAEEKEIWLVSGSNNYGTQVVKSTILQYGFNQCLL